MVDALDHILLNGDPENDERVIIRVLLSRHFWVVGAVLAVLPFSFKKTLDELKKASAAALVFVFMLAGIDPRRDQSEDSSVVTESAKSQSS